MGAGIRGCVGSMDFVVTKGRELGIPMLTRQPGFQCIWIPSWAGGPPEQASLRRSFGGMCVRVCILWNLEQGRGNTCALVRKHPLHKSTGVTVKSLEAGGPDSDLHAQEGGRACGGECRWKGRWKKHVEILLWWILLHHSRLKWEINLWPGKGCGWREESGFRACSGSSCQAMMCPLEEGHRSYCQAGLYSTTIGIWRVVRILQRAPSFSLEPEKEVRKSWSVSSLL